MTIDKPPKVAKISNGKLYPRYHYKKSPIAFLSRKSRNTISLLCDTCRMKNSTRYIAKEHHQQRAHLSQGSRHHRHGYHPI